jgi:3-phenylpropionate/trans-cinnamate dioxygenase ferredoxin subunit
MTDYVRVATLEEVPPGKGRPVFVAGATVALFNVNGDVYALDDACPHQGSSLAMGKLDGAIVQCRAHGLRFDVRTGCMPGVDGLRAATRAVRVTGKVIAVAVDTPSCPGASGKGRTSPCATDIDAQGPQGQGGSPCFVM